ncbi:hypothetical protein AAGC94_04935 [Clostridium sporogenes]|uniref:hypothetical protein n=1 Tax=Clostridium TaxID=1485 RepID=UPI000DF95AAC|nr:hypothetical protein [Clostridium sporogenes]MCW6086555.1 hypothetical protein [Clostridium sporogenes]MDU1422673.1 hypothetical protein [Clostridium botulinum]STE73792.1 Uncharacterised protein [Clostridium botulinum]
MNKFTESILINKENPYSEKVKKEIKNINIETVLEDDLSISNSTFQQEVNLLFCLEYKLLIEKDVKRLAYLNYLISYYIFVILTPPFSQELAIKYIKDALKLDRKDEYLEWVEYVNEGN